MSIIRGIFAAFFLFIFLLFFPCFCSAADVLINEIYTPTSSDWVELYNNSDHSVDISSWILDDDGTSTNMLEIPEETTISAKSILVFSVDKRLNKDKDTVYLFDAGKNPQDTKSYSFEAGENISFGRKPDGGGWHLLKPATKGFTNNSADIVDPSPSPSPSPKSSPSSSASSQSAASSPPVTSSPSLEPAVSSEDKEKPIAEEQENEPDFTGEVFGVSESNEATGSMEEGEEKKKFKPSLPLIISMSGIILLVAASFPFLKPKIMGLFKRIRRKA